MAGKKFWRRAAALMITAALAVTPAVTTAFAEDDVDSLKQQQTEYQEQQKENEGKIAQLKDDQSQKEAYKGVLEEQVTTLQNQINTYNTQITELDKNIVKKEGEISEKQDSIDASFALLKERLRALYIAGEASNMEILLSSTSLVDMADKTEAIKMVSDHDAALIDGLNKDLAEIQVQKQEIEDDRKEVSDAKDELAVKQNELTGVVEETQRVITELAGSAEALEAENKRLAQQEADTAEQINQWYAEYYAKLAEEQKKSGGSGSVDTGLAGQVIGGGGSGQFGWPVPSTTNITSLFEPRWGTFHYGIDISDGGVYGQPIVASAAGTVIIADSGGWGGGYGTWVSVDHGNGYSTVYGHMSALCVSVGQQVQQGEVIGFVGNTGDSTGPHCHFEIRVNGVAQDPLGYL